MHTSGPWSEVWGQTSPPSRNPRANKSGWPSPQSSPVWSAKSCLHAPIRGNPAILWRIWWLLWSLAAWRPWNVAISCCCSAPEHTNRAARETIHVLFMFCKQKYTKTCFIIYCTLRLLFGSSLTTIYISRSLFWDNSFTLVFWVI